MSRHLVALIFGLLLLLPACRAQETSDFTLPGGTLQADQSAGTVDSALLSNQDFMEGRRLELTGDLQKAYTLYRRSFLFNPLNYRSVYRAGRLLEAFGKLDDAGAAFRQSIKIAPDFYAAHNALGILLAKMDERQKAIDAFREATKAAPDYAPAWRNLGMALGREDDLRGAEAAYKRALSLDSTDVESRVTLGLLDALRGDRDGASARLRRALALDPANDRARQGLAWLGGGVLVDTSGVEPVVVPKQAPDRLPEVSGSEPVWTYSAPTLHTEDPNLLKRAGIELVRKGEYEKAEETLSRAVAYGGRDELLYATLGFASYQAGHYGDAASAYKHAEDTAWQPTAWYSMNRAIALLRVGELREATKAAVEAVRISPDDARAYYTLGVIRLQRGQNRRATSELKKAVDLDRSYPDAYIALGVAQVRRNHKDKAITAYRNALGLRPGDPNVMMSLATLLQDVGRYGEAGKLYGDFVRVTAGDPRYETWRAYATRKMQELGTAPSARKRTVSESDVEAVNVYSNRNNARTR